MQFQIHVFLSFVNDVSVKINTSASFKRNIGARFDKEQEERKEIGFKIAKISRTVPAFFSKFAKRLIED